jgi:hypothetical protein
LAIRSTAASSRANRLEAVATLGAAAETTEAAAPEATEAATAAPSRIAGTPTRGYACEASMAGHRAATGVPRSPTWVIPVLRDCSPISPQGEFRCKGEQPAMPERVILRPFMPIKLKKAPPGLAPTYPSEIRTAQAAIKFVNSLDPKTRAKLHWKLAASALAALDTGAIRQGAYDRANKAMRNALATECWLAD